MEEKSVRVEVTDKGNGLGFAIAKNLAEALGGTHTLESIPNEKTTFTVSFPERNL